MIIPGQTLENPVTGERPPGDFRDFARQAAASGVWSAA